MDKDLKCTACALGIWAADFQVTMAEAFVDNGDFETAKSILQNLDSGLKARLRRTGLRQIGKVCDGNASEALESLDSALKNIHLARKDEAKKSIQTLKRNIENIWEESSCGLEE